jgi:hypothetical protein
MFRTLSASIIRSSKNYVIVYRLRHSAVATDLGHPHRIYLLYIIPTHDTHQWLLIQFLVLLMMDTENVRNM